MPIRDSLLPEYDAEIAFTRTTLERVPEGKFDFKPHEKSMTQGQLAIHLAQIPEWGAMTIQTDSIDLAQPFEQPKVGSVQELLTLFDKNAAAGRAEFAGASDEKLMANWSMLKAGTTMMTMPRIAVLRSFIMNHMVHHRAQLGVYLRLQNIPVPAIYGPSADEGSF